MGFLNKEDAFDFEALRLSELPGGVPPEIRAVWVSRVYIVRHYRNDKPGGSERLSVDYAVPEFYGSVDTISWDNLQRIKNTLGFEERYAVELFPPKSEEVHSIEQRHLWLVGEPDFGLDDEEDSA